MIVDATIKVVRSHDVELDSDYLSFESKIEDEAIESDNNVVG